ncbi:hypothetical protein GE061_016137 [Apolygus lucorum]|uniref:Uncharacterized protein n=1 Tax=Apolygus lucorum TaxID=248454 RepID=A0A8S9XGH5_APOLU|nr:hypothetical protein GE061_016137 [Apolygus lucorum]
MKTKPANKGSKEPVPRKPKKSERKSIYGREKPDEKKQRRPIQKNRFTSIEELQSPDGNVPLELFGSLIFNLAQETSDVHISDSTGDYELRVSNDTLKEFKLKVLLGVDHRSKPKFTILLGDCQCYPELPEGTLNLESRRVHADDESETNPKNEVIYDDRHKGHYSIETGLVEVNELGHCSENIPEPDTADSVEASIGVTTFEQVSIQKSHISPEQRDADDELTQLSRKSSKSAKKVEKHRSKEHKKNSQVKRQRPVKMPSGASTYMNNLEGFIQFLMNDEICYSALANTRAPPNVTKVARRIVGGRNLIKYSDGKEFLITFEEKDPSNEDKQMSEHKNESSCPPNSVKSDSDDNLSTLKELLSASDDKNGTRLEEEAEAREELMRANEFVETVKNEIVEWQARCEEAIDVTIICNEKGATLTEKPAETGEIGISDVLNALQKVDDVYEDATSDSSNMAQADSLEQFFLELDEYEKVAVSKETNVTVTLDKDLTPDIPNNVKAGATSVKSEVSHFQHRYVPPIPLNMTSSKDIELMWMAFVKQFCSSDGRLNPEPINNTARTYKSDLHFGQYRQSYSDVTVGSKGNITKNSNMNSFVDKLHPRQNLYDIGCSSNTMTNSSKQICIDQNVYPGQNCLPYFVEANLKRVNSVMGSIQVSSSHTSHINKSEHNFMLFGNSHAGVPEQKYNFSSGVHILNPGKFNSIGERRSGYPLKRNANTLPKERFPNQRNRIFFNPNVSAGDWY